MSEPYFIKNIFSKFLDISGEDSKEFLQGLITNDINNCKEHMPIYACLLTPQGKFLADFFIIKLKNNFLIEIHEKYYETFVNKLTMYKLRSKINIQENVKIESVIFFSKKIPFIEDYIITFQDPRSLNIGHKVYLNQDNNTIIRLEKFKEQSYDKYKEILMKNLVIHSPDDLIENKSLLLENNFQNINAINWEKGCYVGQEITARMKYRALLRKQLYVLKIKSGEVNIGDKILDNNIIIGEVMSKSKRYFLAMLKISLVEENIKNNRKLGTNKSSVVILL